jgi:hypothetical protein
MNNSNKTKNHTNGESHNVAIGVGIAALAAAAAGAYYLYGSDKGAARRKKLKSWTLRMKAEVMEEIEKLKDVNKEAYEATIATIASKYQQLKDVDPAEVTALASKMKTHWRDIQRDITSAAAPRRKAVRAKPRTTAKKNIGARKNNS